MYCIEAFNHKLLDLRLPLSFLSPSLATPSLPPPPLSCREIQELLDASLGIVRDQALYSPRYSSHDSYLLLVAVDRDVTSPPTWEGKTVPIDVAFETTIAISEMEVCCIISG